jgi:hypothetical protein
MGIKVFVLGRPGSGKSFALRIIVEYIKQRNNKWSVSIVRDYEILWQMFIANRTVKNEPRKFLPTDYDSFEVIDFSVLDDASKEIEKSVKTIFALNEDKIIFIEFARDNYQVALRQFTREFLQDAYFLLVEAELKTCIRRIHKRIAHPDSIDDHFVSDNIMRSYYCLDNKDYMLTNFKQEYGIEKEIEVLENSGSVEDFTKKVHHFISIILDKEV